MPTSPGRGEFACGGCRVDTVRHLLEIHGGVSCVNLAPKQRPDFALGGGE